MATKQIYHNTDYQGVGQLIRVRYQNVNNAEMTSLGSTLGAANAGIPVWNTENEKKYIWDGSEWVGQEGPAVRTFFGTVSLVAGQPLNVQHNLDLIDRDAFTINTMKNNSAVSVDVDSVDSDNLTLTSLVSVSDVKVTIIGF